MPGEELELIRSSLLDFLTRELSGREQEFEKIGIPRDFVEKLAQQGFLAAAIPTELGGSGLDRLAYFTILMNIARFSGSAALRVMLLNGVIYRVLKKMGKEEIVRDIISGASSISIDTSLFTKFWAAGKEKFFVDPEAPMSIFMLDGQIVLARVSLKGSREFRPLGFRGLKFGDPQFEVSERVAAIKDSGKFVDSLMAEISGDIAAVAIGMSEAALEKAMEYSRVRKAFGVTLSSFQPLAFPLSIMSVQLKTLREFLLSDSGRSAADMIGIRELAADFAVVSSKQALQTHGGYGYIEDFGVEKFYRDSLALNSLFGEKIHSMTLLAKEYYGEEAGNL
ncbi:MAG: acyl-CoA/acyl-ACP dehydrogenase [Candidatus Thermoplasmatota archaeon]|nr:acyl-CoA/acyl-ACP dehydrogenase [Candidatus Thermoplasmatota archaeon]MCL5799788.1 acyl-CoA/acyl-ACP dehydrogenase [Candidatus Thermoplasmatota archaeon]